MQKKKGFTLIELLVVMLISSLILSLVAGTMIFITNSAGKLIQEAEDIDMAKNIEKYLRGLVEKGVQINENDKEIKLNNGVIKIENDNLLFDGKVVFTNTGLINKEIITYVDGFIKCYLEFDSGKKFEFILGVN